MHNIIAAFISWDKRENCARIIKKYHACSMKSSYMDMFL